MELLTAHISSPGGRAQNQDDCRYLVDRHAACWVVADGLGGHRGGERAAHLAVEAITASFRADPALSEAALTRHLDAAQTAVRHAQQADARYAAMRTTVVVLLTDYRTALWAHIGDSRLYVFRQGHLLFQTRDHSVPQALVDAGELAPEQVRLHEDRSRLLRALGTEPPLQPTLAPEPLALQPGDTFLLCSDGFWEHVTEAEMEADLRVTSHPEAWLARMEQRIRRRARGTYDNYTGLAVQAVPEATMPEAAAGRRRAWSRPLLGAGAALLLVLLHLAVQAYRKPPLPTAALPAEVTAAHPLCARAGLPDLPFAPLPHTGPPAREGACISTRPVDGTQWPALMGWLGAASPDAPAADSAGQLIARLNARAGGSFYRLPQPEEWTAACRAGLFSDTRDCTHAPPAPGAFHLLWQSVPP